MVKHIILWKLKDEHNNDAVKNAIKEGLEGLRGVIPGLVEIRVQAESLPSSTASLMLYSVFESAEALTNYAGHPLHLAAKEHFWNFLDSRVAADYEV
jgi:hypothetical protein